MAGRDRRNKSMLIRQQGQQPDSVYIEKYEIDPRHRDGHFHDYISVQKTRPRIGYSNNTPATVNWSACGEVTPEKARKFAKALLAAADMAESLDAFFSPQTEEVNA